LYAILELTPQASEQDIKKAFRRLSVTHHPDKGGSSEQFQKINEAYSVLSNSEKRAHYDATGSTDQKMPSPMGGHPFEQLFAQMNRTQPVIRKGQMKTIPLKVRLQDVYNQVQRKLTFPIDKVCSACTGRGSKSQASYTCKGCDGSGKKTFHQQTPVGIFVQHVPCGDCKGTGWNVVPDDDRCPTCLGQRLVKGQHTVDYKLNKSMNDQETFIIENAGDEIPDGIPGDVVISVSIRPDDTFSRVESSVPSIFMDLVVLHKISLIDALTGGTFRVNHIDGSEMSVHLPIVNPRTEHIVPGRGWTSQGNCRIKFDIEFPTTVTQEQKAWLKKQKASWI